MSIFYTLAGNSLHLLAEITRKSGRYQVEGVDHLLAAQAAGPVVMTAWHGMTMMLAGFFLNHYDDPRKLLLILPDDWHGGVLQVWINKMGAQPFPMDLTGESGMSAARQLSRLIKLIRAGNDSYITPDGPEGPAYQVKPGVVYLAQKTGATILPLGAYTRSAYRVNRWDQYAAPYPFSRLSLVIGEPVDSAGDTAEVGQRIQTALHQVAAQAAANYYEKRA
jgi:lysophospholipid acyltransferase (LPLAT)-like uncharacterized protein